MVCVFGRQIRFCSFLLRNLAALYDGACMLLITGRSLKFKMPHFLDLVFRVI